MTERIKLLNITFDNLTETEFFDRCQSGLVVTPNVDFLIKCQTDRRLYEIINSAEWSICDSQLLFLAAKFLNRPLKQKLSGSDIFPRFCLHHQNNEKIKIFLMGAKEGVAKIAANKINTKVGREIIINYYSPKFGYEEDQKETNKMIQLFNESGASVFALGTGCPKSEKWFHQNRDKLNAKLMFCIGATIDFEAGNIQRSPKWMSTLCLEWLYRLIKEPKRLYRRYLIEDPKFFLLLLKEKMGFYKNPF